MSSSSKSLLVILAAKSSICSTVSEISWSIIVTTNAILTIVFPLSIEKVHFVICRVYAYNQTPLVISLIYENRQQGSAIVLKVLQLSQAVSHHVRVRTIELLGEVSVEELNHLRVVHAERRVIEICAVPSSSLKIDRAVDDQLDLLKDLEVHVYYVLIEVSTFGEFLKVRYLYFSLTQGENLLHMVMVFARIRELLVFVELEYLLVSSSQVINELFPLLCIFRQRLSQKLAKLNEFFPEHLE